MSKYRIFIADSQNERISEWKELYTNTAEEAGRLLASALKSDMDIVGVDIRSSVTDEYAMLWETRAGEEHTNETLMMPKAIGRAIRGKRYEPQDRYDKKNTKRVQLKLNTKTDADILEHLSKVGNKQGYIKNLIRADIK